MADNEIDKEPAPRRRRSRREFVAAAAGALGALAATSIIKAPTASANSGDNLVIGRNNSADLQTSLLDNSSGVTFTQLYVGRGQGIALYGDSISSEGIHGKSQNFTGVYAESLSSYGIYAIGGNTGVVATSPNGEGLFGQHGVKGNPTTRSGVHGATDSANDSGVLGENFAGGVGVSGVSSGNQAGVEGTSASGNGVHGVSTDLNGVGAGVLGEQKGASGIGVVGVGTVGVQGNSNAPGHTGVIGVGTTGVYGQALSGGGGVGVLAINGFDGSGLALVADGASTFNGPIQANGSIQATRSGVASITYPKRTVSVAVPGGLTASSLVLATIQNVVAGVYVASAVPNTGTGKVAINLNKPPGSATTPLTAKVAWFVVN